MTATKIIDDAKKSGKISLANVNRLNALGHVAFVYPRKKMVAINGGPAKYRLS